MEIEYNSGSAEYYFDQSLTGLLNLLGRTLPDRDHCLRYPRYADEENQRYQSFCIQALDYTLGTAESLLSQRRHNYHPFRTHDFSASTLSTVRNTLQCDSTKLNDEGRERIQRLIHDLNRLENLDLDDDEYADKWAVLEKQLQSRSAAYLHPLDNPLQEQIEGMDLSDDALHRLILSHDYPTDCIIDVLRTRRIEAEQAQSTSSEDDPGINPEEKIREALGKITDDDLSDAGRMYFRPIWEAIIANPDLLKLFTEVHPKSYSKRDEMPNDWNVMLFLNIFGLLKDFDMFNLTAKKLTARIYNVEHGLYIDNWEPKNLNKKTKTTVVTEDLKSTLLAIVRKVMDQA